MDTVVSVECGDVLERRCDVLVVKYAQAHYGVDRAVADALRAVGVPDSEMSPRAGGFRIHPSRGAIAAREIMFAGTDPLARFGYRNMRQFARKAIADIAGSLPEVQSIALTTHGAGYGLDEAEAFASLVAGITDALRGGDTPTRLAEVVIVERNLGRARRLTEELRELIPDRKSPSRAEAALSTAADERLRAAGYGSDAKPHVFVAMPFSDAMFDNYHYGIEKPVNDAGYLCERVDTTVFTGDILSRIRERIETARAVIADLSGANPNVYLEAGYAWGRKVPTILLTNNVDELCFDVKAQRCIVYQQIVDLEKKISVELRGLLVESD